MVRNCADETLCSRLRIPSTQHRHFLKNCDTFLGEGATGGYRYLGGCPHWTAFGGCVDFRGMSFRLLLLFVVLVAVAAARRQGVDEDSSFCEGLD